VLVHNNLIYNGIVILLYYIKFRNFGERGTQTESIRFYEGEVMHQSLYIRKNKESRRGSGNDDFILSTGKTLRHKIDLF
jgi:hypothetical protein